MATRLEGAATRFLPFNQGSDGGAGNPLNPGGHPTAYLWEHIWARDGWLEILGCYLVAERNEKKVIARVLFPRYHQLAATRKLVDDVRARGPGGRYLIQHSAGSGKTNSIAWTAHFLSELHDDGDRKVFDTVLVVSDRTVIDTQLQEAIHAFERTQARAAGDPPRSRGPVRRPAPAGGLTRTARRTPAGAPYARARCLRFFCRYICWSAASSRDSMSRGAAGS
jgi:type I site-specific restriction-modification system R (restriction) subunit